MLHVIGNLAFILVACSFMAKDMLWLRGLSVSASIFSLIYNYNVAGHPLWVPITWNTFFMSLNLYHIFNIVRGNKAIVLTDKEKELFQLGFSNLSLMEFSKLMKIAKWKLIDPQITFINEGQKMIDLMMIYNGNVEIVVENKTVNELKDGQFIGEMSFLSDGVASASVKAKLPTEMVVWNQLDLKDLMKRNPSIIYSLQSAMGEQMAKSLKAKNYNENNNSH
jgi:CRP-like cAMP-binding protein